MNNFIDINDYLPNEHGYYLVELQICDIPDIRETHCEFFENGEFQSAQFVNKWAKITDWVEADKCLPPTNVGVLVFIPDEDDHITSGMWDVSDKWVLLDEYREPTTPVTHWRLLPEKPQDA